MAGDLEDFLRRAAARRQKQAGEQQRSTPAPERPSQPEHSNRRPERRPRPRVEERQEEIITAEIVEDSISIAARSRRVEATRRAAKEAKQSVRKKRRVGTLAQVAKPEPSQPTAAQSADETRTNLIAALKRPGGIQQAILLREILDRPVHRW